MPRRSFRAVAALIATLALMGACSTIAPPPPVVARPASWAAPEVLVAPSAFSGVHGLAIDAKGRLLAGSVLGNTLWEVDRATGAARILIDAPEGQADEAIRRWINEQIEAAAPLAIERYREDIRRYIEERVAEWNAEEMTVELEHHIGRDLQFIRINGTLVGGLVGLLIHTVTQLLRG